MPWSPVSAVAYSLWQAANLPSWIRFRRALANPERVQRRLLARYLKLNRHTVFGRRHALDQMASYDEFSQRVPLATYQDFEPDITRLRAGEDRLLSWQPVTRLIPTSGTSGGRKLIPFTAGLQQEFDAAIAPWLTDLFLRNPSLMGGPAFWSITPALGGSEPQVGVIPVGFDDDTAYLGGARRLLAQAVMAVPSGVQLAGDLETFRYATLLALLRCEGLRLISVWHPSFLSLLVDALPGVWDDLLEDVAHGSCRIAVLVARSPSDWIVRPQPARAEFLRKTGPYRPEFLWPDLRMISCWSAAAAQLPAAALRLRFPQTPLQPKGLLATEAIVTIPFAGVHPVALNSHFFEFLDESGKCHLVNDLRRGEIYEVVVTTAGGLWRYRMGDRVQVDGMVQATPSLRFMGRGETVSDRCGEKLDHDFVAGILHALLASHPPAFAMLAPDDASGLGYTLYLEGSPPADCLAPLETMLRANPHYAYCRTLGQLRAARLFLIDARGYETFLRFQARAGARLGDIKPAALSNDPGWSSRFSGKYIT